MRFKILPVFLFFSFALVVAKVFDLAIEKNSKNPMTIGSDMQAHAGGKTNKSSGENSKKSDLPEKDSVANPAGNDDGSVEASPRPQENAVKGVDTSDKTPSEKALLASFAQRRMQLDDLEHSIAVKESVLNATEKKINVKMEELKKLQGEVAELLEQYKSKEDNKNKKLVMIYEGMKPADAAKIFDTLDIPILLDVVGVMKEESASKIIAKMNTIKAKELTTKFAEQKRLAAK